MHGWVGPILPEKHTRPGVEGRSSFDLLLIFCACPIMAVQNVPGGSVVLQIQMDFRKKKRCLGFLPSKRVLAC